MKKDVFDKAVLRRLRAIHRLSRTYNRKVGVPHDRRLLALMTHHAAEIRELYRRGDRHYLTETGDLLVLCCEIILEGKAPLEGVVRRCLKRYEKKLTALIRETEIRRTGKKK